MKLRIAIAVLLVALIAQAAMAGARLARCERVIDGDTIVVTLDGRDLKIRLYGIDCPERGEPWAEEATEYTRKCVEGNDCWVDISGLDRYGRSVAWVCVDGFNLNSRLVWRGFARWSRKYAPNDWMLSHMEDIARGRKWGLWSEK